MRLIRILVIREREREREREEICLHESVWQYLNQLMNNGLKYISNNVTGTTLNRILQVSMKY